MRNRRIFQNTFASVTLAALTPAFLVGCDGDVGSGSETVDTTTVTSAVTATAGASWVSRVGLTNAQYQSEVTNWIGKGYRPTYVSGYVVNNQDYYAAIWENSSVQGWIAHHAMTPAGFAQQISANASAGYHLAMANGYTLGGSDLYVAVWEYGTTPTIVAKYPLTASQVQSTVSAQAQLGYRAIQISGYGGSTEEFMILFQKTTGPKQIVRAGQTASQFNVEYNFDISAGYHLSQENTYYIAGVTHYVSIFDFGSSSVPQKPAFHMYQNGYQQNLTELGYQGYRPVNVSGGLGGLQTVNQKLTDVTVPQFSALWQNYVMSASDLGYIDETVNNALSASGTPAATLAVAKNGRLVYAKAFGYADTATSTPATTASVFRIASISKPITSAAILTLMERGLLSLDDTVFGTQVNPKTGRPPLLGSTYGTQPYGSFVTAVTVRDLLSHSSGGWSGDEGGSGDPVFAMNWANQASDNAGAQTAMINWAIDQEPLRFTPGTAYGYSNFGFVLLGRIIEAVATKNAGTPQQYDAWVEQNVLIPAGASDMKIGQNTKVARWPNEVTYYDPTGQGDPYSWNIPLMEANGGWVASAIDLLRFVVRVDGLTPPPDFLLPSTETTMLTPFNLLWPPNYTTVQNSGYGLGWGIGPDTTTVPACQISPTNPCTIQSHDGFLGPGTTANLFATSSGLSYALIANGQTLKEPDTLNSVVTGVTAWPSHDSAGYDLFQQPNLAFYDPPTPGAPSYQCTVGTTTMHCCPPGSVMIGADDGQGVFKCAPVLTTGTVTLDPQPNMNAYQCNGMHCCPPNQVMVGLRADQNILACMPLPAGSLTTQRVDYKTHDTYPIHVCDAATPVAAMVGIDVGGDRLTCATDPHLQ